MKTSLSSRSKSVEFKDHYSIGETRFFQHPVSEIRVDLSLCFLHLWRRSREENAITVPKMLYGRSGVEFIGLAFELAEADNLNQPCKKKKKMSGSDWLETFVKFKILSLRTSESTSVARMTGFIRPEVKTSF
jgi:hypothetical protein